jgi:hypothetical protein
LTDPTAFVDALIGKPVSHVWRGFGSAIFFEFGELIPGKERKGKEGNPIGELTLMIEWSWRIEKPRSILGGSWSSEGKWQGMFNKLVEANVVAVEFFGHIPEICISLSNGLRISSFSTVEGQPEWALLTRKPALGSLCVKVGRLSVDLRGS